MGYDALLQVCCIGVWVGKGGFGSHKGYNAVQFERSFAFASIRDGGVSDDDVIFMWAPQPLRVGDWVRVRPSIPAPSHQWGPVNHESLGVIHRIDEEGDLWAAFCFLERRWVCKAGEMERVEPFLIGQTVRIRRGVVNPRLGWGNETHASRGTVALVDADGKLRVRFRKCTKRLWIGDPADVERCEA